MALLQLRKLVVQLEGDPHRDGPRGEPAVAQQTVAAVIANPCAGRYVEDLSTLVDLGAEVAELLAARRGSARRRAGRGHELRQGAIVGIGGEIEHAAALLHPRFGAPVRRAVHRATTSSCRRRRSADRGRS